MIIRKTYALTAILAVAFFSIASRANAIEVDVDFGTPNVPSPAGWNDARGIYRSGSITLETSTGASTGYSLVTTKGFTDHQPYGTQAPVAGVPSGATVDGMYGNEQLYESYSSPYGQLQVTDLDPALYYTFKIFASVDRNDSLNRTTLYELTGATTVSGSLNPTDNTSTFVTLSLKPSAAGDIFITVKKGAGNTTVQGFYHIAHFRMFYTLPAANQPPVVNPTASPATLTLPSNTTTLAANATDAGGAISAYLWTKVTGGAATITSPNSAKTTVTGLEAGSYSFNVRVTDNLGAFTNKTIKVTVTAPVGLSVPSYRLYNNGEVGNPYGYVEYLPRGYTQASAKSLPILIFMHGKGEMGEGKRDPNSPSSIAVASANGGIGKESYSSGGIAMAYLNKLLLFGPNTFIRAGHDLPFVVLSIQQFYGPCPGACDWNMGTVDQFVTFALAKYKVNPLKVHMTGLSLGGGGSLNYALTHPERIASLATICSGYYNQQSLTLTQNIVNNGVGVWAATSIIDDQADFQTRLRQFVSNMGYSLGSRTDILYHLTVPDGAIPKTTNPETVTNINSVLPTPYGAWSATYNPTSHQWDWKAGQDYHTPAGTLPAYPLAFTIYTDVHSHYIWDRMYNDSKLYDWIARQSR